MRKTIFIWVFLLLFPSCLLADGMMISRPDRYIFETDQKGVIFFEDGEETLILSVSFKGDAEDFAWIVPTPEKPQVEKAFDELFTALREYTQPHYGYDGYAYSVGMQSITPKDAPRVIVHEKKQIEYYDITVLSANEKNALLDWLENNGYRFPKQYSYVLDSYIKNEWYFTAVKIIKDLDPSVLQKDMWEGSLIPLQFKFKTDKPVYPLKISSVIHEPSDEINKFNLNVFTDGKIGDALKIGKMAKVNANYNSLDLTEGTIEMWVRINQKNHELANAVFLSITDKKTLSENIYFGVENGTMVLSFWRSFDFKSAQEKEVFSNSWYGGQNLNFYRNWNHVAVSWKKNEAPIFYFNGKMLSTKPSQLIPDDFNIGSGFKEIYFGASRVIGGAAQGLDVDETRISAGALKYEEILSNYNDGQGRKFLYDKNTVFLASFDKNLTYFNNLDVGLINYFNPTTVIPKNAPPNSNIKPDQIGIELYIFTKDKEQTLPGFNTSFTSWLDKKTIENFARDDKGDAWIKLKNDHYYLTKLNRNMKYSEMTNDLYFRDAEKNSDILKFRNYEKTVFVFLVVLGSLITLGVLIIIIKQFNRD